jgi:hypothetical protein
MTIRGWFDIKLTPLLFHRQGELSNSGIYFVTEENLVWMEKPSRGFQADVLILKPQMTQIFTDEAKSRCAYIKATDSVLISK